MTAVVNRCPFTGEPSHRCTCEVCGPLPMPRTKPCGHCGCKCRVIEPYDMNPRGWVHEGPSRTVKRMAAA